MNLANHNSPKRPQGNKFYNGAKFAFVQDNGAAKQEWRLERHPSQPRNTWRLVDKTGHCLVANDPNAFKRNKVSSYIVARYGVKSACSFWKKEQSGNGWNLVLAKQGSKFEAGKFAYMYGWGLAVLNHLPLDKELGADRSYLVLHKNSKKWSIWGGGILGAPANVTANITASLAVNDTAADNDTDNATAEPTPAAAPVPTPAAAPATPATGAAKGAAAPVAAGNNTNKTNKSKNATKRALPTPYDGDDSDDDDVKNIDRTIDINDPDEFAGDEDETIREKVMKATNYYSLSSGYVHVKWLKWMKLFEDESD